VVSRLGQSSWVFMPLRLSTHEGVSSLEQDIRRAQENWSIHEGRIFTRREEVQMHTPGAQRLYSAPGRSWRRRRQDLPENGDQWGSVGTGKRQAAIGVIELDHILIDHVPVGRN
jgi:hypothetical protein